MRQEKTAAPHPKARVCPDCGHGWEEHKIKGRPVVVRLEADQRETLILEPQWRCP